MKNKKLFAILTLVCFMFTLMPVAAFAAAPTEPEVGAYVVKNGTDKDSVTVQATETLTVAVTGSALNYYYWAEDADENVIALGNTTAAATADFAFEDVDTYYVFAVAAGDGIDTVYSNGAASTKAQIVNTIKDRYDAYIVDDYLTVKVKKADTTYALTGPASVSIKADNGWTAGGEVVVTLTKNLGTPVRGEAIKFSTNSAYVNVELVDAVTDRSGDQEIKITASRAGNYKVYASYGDADRLAIAVNVTVDGLKAITTVAEPTKAVALDSTFAYGLTDIAFDITNTDGTESKGALTVNDDYKIAVVAAPADSNIDEDALTLEYDGTTNYAYVLKGATALDEEGTYTFKVTLKNGASATATVKVVEFDEPVMMSLTYPANTITLGNADGYAKKALVFIDKNGTVLSAAHPDYDASGVEYAANGKAVAGITAAGAVKTVAYDEDLIGSTITVLAINEELELTASATLTVADNAAGLKYTKTTADVAVNNNLVVNTVDAEGNVVAAGLSAGTTTVSVYVLSAPANAVYAVSGAATDVNKVVVSFTASVAGEYKLQTVVREGVAYYSSIDTIVVGGTAGQFEDVVVMSIGANKVVVNSDVKAIPAAPMIKDARTFVPFRALAEAFGADVEWVEATQSVVAELNGVKVVMVIGEEAYTVNGVAKTADVAPFINGASTMVPVRFVAEAFGITVTPIYAEDGTVADVLFAK